MALAALAGQVGRVQQTIAGAPTAVVSTIMDKLGGFGLRNEDSLAHVGSIVSSVGGIISDLASFAGSRPPMYTIGEVQNDDGSGVEKSLGMFGGVGSVASTVVRAVSSITGGESQKGVIIDGYDNQRGNISVALPENPMMYTTSITNNRVRQPNTFTMRVYVSNLNADNLLDNLKQTVMSAFGGVGNMILGQDKSRAQTALESLQYIQEQGRPFRVYSVAKTWENMLIQDIVPVNDSKSNDMLQADITFKEIIFYQPFQNVDLEPARKSPSAAVNSIASLFK